VIGCRRLILAIVAVGALANWRVVAAQDESNQPEQVLSHGFDCFSCHAIDREVVGPAWSAIAERYHHDAAKAAYLAGKIRAGSVGDFGPVPMPAHQDIDPKLATQLANYILSLKTPTHAAPERKYRYKDANGKKVTVDFQIFEQAKGHDVVTDEIFAGFEKYDSYCFRCHGFDAVGGEYAPDLRKSLTNGMTRHEFFVVAMEGRESKGMPGWAGFFSAAELGQIYEYVRARSLDLIGPGRPPSKTD
jgi:cytochrome c